MQTWWLKTYGTDIAYAGNSGYEEDPTKLYRYDSFVPNHKNITVGDFAVLQEPERTIGIGQIINIDSKQGQKTRYRCPECNSPKIKKRKKKSPLYRCQVNKHEFEEPIEEIADCIHYIASFGDTFVRTPDALSNEQLKHAALKYNKQNAMQTINIASVLHNLKQNNSRVDKLFHNFAIQKSIEEEAAEDFEDEKYSPSTADNREKILKSIRIRRGQAKFREKLLKRHNRRCIISACPVVHVLEAAHIHPYRSNEDHSVANGLLLRSDIHSLFDLYLIGIQPRTYLVNLHPSLFGTEYEEYKNQRLLMPSNFELNLEALRIRWESFLANLTIEE